MSEHSERIMNTVASPRSGDSLIGVPEARQ
jgi:hypothetical protein